MTVDVVKQLEQATRQLTSETTSEPEQVCAIDTIVDYVDNMDNANDFCKIGGLSIILPCLSSKYAKVRSGAASLVAELAQNNPYCQQQLLDASTLPKLIDLLSEPNTATYSIHAISCMVRNYEPALAAFIDIGGLECLLGCLQKTDEEKLIIRSLFLLSAICSEFPPVRDELIKLKAVEQIIATLRPTAEYDVRLETTLSALCLFTENPDAVARCHDSELNFRETIEEILKVTKDKPECQETIEYCNTLKERVYTAQRDSTDR